MEGVVKIPELMEYFKREGLVLVKREEAENLALYQESEKELLRRKLMRKKALKLNEIAKAGFFGVGTKKGVQHIVKNHLSDAEYFKSGSGVRAPILVLTSAVVRISKLKGVLHD